MSAAVKSTDKSHSLSRMRIALSVLGIGLAVVAAGIWITLGAGAGSGGEPKGTLHLETFVLNLADPGQKSYLRVGMDLGLARATGQKEIVPIGQVRDTILGVLAESKVEELITAAGKTKLKADLLRALQERVPGLEVEQVYFTEFLIQR